MPGFECWHVSRPLPPSPAKTEARAQVDSAARVRECLLEWTNLVFSLSTYAQSLLECLDLHSTARESETSLVRGTIDDLGHLLNHFLSPANPTVH